MENYKIKLVLGIFCLFFINSYSYSQKQRLLTETEIKKLAKYLKQEGKGKDFLGNGVKLTNCYAMGRTITYVYTVPKTSIFTQNYKSDIIKNAKNTSFGKICFQQKINLTYCYIGGITKIIEIKYNELSPYNYKLGDYINLKDHSKAKGVNLKIRVPIDWEEKESNRPNIVKKFSKEKGVYMVTIKNNRTFLSRTEATEIYNDKGYTDNLINELASFYKKFKIIKKSIVTIDRYPALKIKFKGEAEQLGYTIPMTSIYWYILYEDKIIILSANSYKQGVVFETLEPLFMLITNSIVFQEQYN